MRPFSIENSEIDKIIDNLLSTFNSIKAETLLAEVSVAELDHSKNWCIVNCLFSSRPKSSKPRSTI